jgi:hypothetical protein
MGWLEEISFRDKPSNATNCITILLCCVFISAIKSNKNKYASVTALKQ